MGMVRGNYIQFYYYNLNFQNLSSDMKVLWPRDTHQSTQEVRFSKEKLLKRPKI
jgi:hypothetical protein